VLGVIDFGVHNSALYNSAVTALWLELTSSCKMAQVKVQQQSVTQKTHQFSSPSVSVTLAQWRSISVLQCSALANPG